MGRPRKYTCAAEKQAAYRRRLKQETVLLDRRQWQQLDRLLADLQNAIGAAMDRNDPFARQCWGGSYETMLHKMALAFRRVATP